MKGPFFEKRRKPKLIWVKKSRKARTQGQVEKSLQKMFKGSSEPVLRWL